MTYFEAYDAVKRMLLDQGFDAPKTLNALFCCAFERGFVGSVTQSTLDYLIHSIREELPADAARQLRKHELVRKLVR